MSNASPYEAAPETYMIRVVSEAMGCSLPTDYVESGKRTGPLSILPEEALLVYMVLARQAVLEDPQTSRKHGACRIRGTFSTRINAHFAVRKRAAAGGLETRRPRPRTVGGRCSPTPSTWNRPVPSEQQQVLCLRSRSVYDW